MTEQIPSDPIPLFHEWLEEAKKSEINDPEAMAIATVDQDGKPGVRMVLLKGADENGFKFHTNFDGGKGQALQKNPVAELCFHWKTLRKQVRVSGPVEAVSDEEADLYYNTRSRESRIGAWASQQSRVMESYEELQRAYQEMIQKFDGQENIPRPDYWGGFRVIPKRIEFWQDGDHRLHKRFVYERDSKNWKTSWLFP